MTPGILWAYATPFRWYHIKQLQIYFVYMGVKQRNISFQKKSIFISNFLCFILHFCPYCLAKIPFILLDYISDISFLPRVAISLCCVSSMGMEKLLPEVREEMQACWRWGWTAFRRTSGLHLELNGPFCFLQGGQLISTPSRNMTLL